jgi:small subunit ribosomal protein S21
MAIRIKARSGESAEQMLRRFKKLCEKEGLTKDIKRRAYYEKPSERKQRALRKSVKRAQQLVAGFKSPRNPRNPRKSPRNPRGPRNPRPAKPR